MAQQYKFYRNADNVGIMEKYPTGENVVVFGSGTYFVLTTPTGVSLKPITVGNPTYTILFADLINDLNVAAISIDEASEIIGGVLGVISSGGGGGDATTLNQTTQITAANALNTNIGATNAPLSATPAAVASLISIMKGFWSALVTTLTNKSQNTQIVDSGLIDGVKVVGNALQVAQQGDINIANFPAAVVLAFGADALQQSDPDVNGNYQTIEYFTGGLAGTLIKTISLTFDANGEVLTYEQI